MNKEEMNKWMNGMSRWNATTYRLGLVAGLGVAILGSTSWMHFLGAVLACVNVYGIHTLRRNAAKHR